MAQTELHTSCGVNETQLDTCYETHDTQLDKFFEISDEGQGAEEAVVCEAPVKKAKLDPGPRDCSRDCIRWVATPTGLVPFVKNGETQIIHSGKCQMRVDVVTEKVKLVVCLSGCGSGPEYECGMAHCSCLCHLLRAFYAERAIEEM